MREPTTPTSARLVRLYVEHWDVLDKMADSRGVSRAKLMRKAVEQYTHAPDTAHSYRRRVKRTET